MRLRYNAEILGPRHVHQRVLNEYIDQLLSKGAKAVADALKDLARDSEVLGHSSNTAHFATEIRLHRRLLELR